jgi:hypothetical protein
VVEDLAGRLNPQQIIPQKIFKFLGNLRITIVDAVCSRIKQKITVPQGDTIAADSPGFLKKGKRNISALCIVSRRKAGDASSENDDLAFMLLLYVDLPRDPPSGKSITFKVRILPFFKISGDRKAFKSLSIKIFL